jgi:hypothetical protein
MKTNHWNNVELRDNRYNQIIHMVSAAKGAEEFYSIEVSFTCDKDRQVLFDSPSLLHLRCQFLLLRSIRPWSIDPRLLALLYTLPTNKIVSSI